MVYEIRCEPLCEFTANFAGLLYTGTTYVLLYIVTMTYYEHHHQHVSICWSSSVPSSAPC